MDDPSRSVYRVEIRLPGIDAAVSLLRLLHEFPHRSTSVRGLADVSINFEGIPPGSDVEARLHRIVTAWANDAGIDAVIVTRDEPTFAPRGAVGGALRRILTWKLEDGPEAASDIEDHPEDVGPAWIDTFEDDTHVASERVAAGEWITRAEARRIADTNGYELSEDG